MRGPIHSLSVRDKCCCYSRCLRDCRAKANRQWLDGLPSLDSMLAVKVQISDLPWYLQRLCCSFLSYPTYHYDPTILNTAFKNLKENQIFTQIEVQPLPKRNRNFVDSKATSTFQLGLI